MITFLLIGASIIAVVSFLLFYGKPAPALVMPDSAVVDKVKDLPEVRAFVSKYPSSSPSVYREDYFAVTYRVAKHEVPGEQFTEEEYATGRPRAVLSILLSNNLQIESIEFLCSQLEAGPGSFIITTGITEYLQNEQHCWNDTSPPMSETINDRNTRD